MRVHYHRRRYNGLGMLALLCLGIAAVIKLWPLAVLGLLAYVGYYVVKTVLENRSKDVKRGRTILADEAAKERQAYATVMAGAEPRTVHDTFGTCPHCGHVDTHMIRRVEGTKATRNCAVCLRDWTVDHAAPTQSRNIGLV